MCWHFALLIRRPTGFSRAYGILFSSFLQGVNIACYAEPVWVVRLFVHLSVRPSVCLSYTRWHCVKTTPARITKSSLTDSARTPVFRIKSSSRNSKGFTPSEGVIWEWGRKIRNLQPISLCISEMVQDRNKVTILLMTNRKSIRRCDWCQNQQPCMTLNGR